MIKIAFLSWHFNTPQIFLDSIIKMTPGRKGIWKNIQATTNINEADYYFIMDGYNGELPDAKNKAIYHCQHPKTPGSPQEKTFENKEAVVKLLLSKYLNPGEWWISHDYDYLTALKAPVKTKKLFVAHTYQMHNPMYAARPQFMAEFINRYPDLEFDLYGRPSERFYNDPILSKRYKGVLGIENYDALKGEHIIGKDALIDYDYSIEFDVGPCINYFSERLYDALLLWTTPIYSGCLNMSEHLPHGGKAYYVFNPSAVDHEVDYVYKCLQQPKYLKEIAEVRDILLNKYQMWAYCHDVVNNIEKYQGN